MSETPAPAGDINPFAYLGPQSEPEVISHANAHAYQWGYLDAKREDGVRAPAIPDGFAFAWLEYVRRNPSRMSIQDGFRVWRQTGTLPGLSSQPGRHAPGWATTSATDREL